jgi:hypothetical protein|tara:strand:+ start:796 stop:2877 length:2082 start_codon:yes stop_codon:yes gene_type:complete
MSDATILPQLQLFLWGTKTAPNPTLTSPLEDSATAQTVTFSSAPLDSAAAKLTGDFLIAVRNSAGFTEVMYIPAAGMSADGLTATGVIRGINTGGGSIDYTATGGADYRSEHEQGSVVFCPASSTHMNIIIDWIQGTSSMASGGTSLTIGDETDTDVTIQAALTSTVGFLRKDAGTGKAQYSNDGTVWVNIDSVTASNLVDVSATDTTPGYLQDKLIGDGTTTSTTLIGGGGDEDLQISANGTLANMISDVTTTQTELDQALDGISANVTATNLNTLTAGSSSNADALHTHANPVQSFTAYETITTDDAVALLPIECEYFAQLDDEGANNEIALGDANARRRYAIKFTPSLVPSFTTMNIRGRESAGAATTITMDVTIETDTAGEPSGTAVTNGTISGVDPSGWGATFADRLLTFPGVPTMVADTDYWLVFEASATDAGNYIEFATNDDFDENYLSFERLTYDVDTTTWGGSTTTATPFFWTVSTASAMGMALVPTDANFGGRTWSFIGFAKAGGAAQADIDIYIERVPDLSSLEPNVDYYLSSTAGEITATKPTSRLTAGNSYKIGRATSTTDLTIEKQEKFYWATEAAGVTTITQHVTWFRPRWVEIDWSTFDSATQHAKGSGVYDGTSNYTDYLQMDDGGAETTAIRTSNTIFGTQFTAVGSAISDAGFTHTVTDAGTGSGYAYMMKIHG